MINNQVIINSRSRGHDLESKERSRQHCGGKTSGCGRRRRSFTFISRSWSICQLSRNGESDSL